MDRDSSVVVDRDSSVGVDRDSSVGVDRESSVVVDRDSSVVVDRDSSVVVDRDSSVGVDRESSVVVDRDSSVGVETRYELNGPGIESRWGRDFSHPSIPALGHIQPPIQRVSFLWVKRLGRGVGHPPHLTPPLKKEQSYTSTPPLGVRCLL